MTANEAYGGRGVWCVAELRHGELVPTIYELLNAGKALASALGEPLRAVVLGAEDKARAAAEAVAGHGPDKVYVLGHPLLQPCLEDAYARALKDLIGREKPGKILLPASTLGRSLAARLCVLCEGGLVGDATELSVGQDRRLLAVRPCYAGNLLVSVALRRGPEIATLRPMAYARIGPQAGRGEIVRVPVDPSSWPRKARLLSSALEAGKELDLSSTEKIVSGGRGLGSPRGFDLIRDLARALGAAVGASRATVDAGWISYQHQVGLTGRTVRPRLYVACGISGQIQHLAGMSSSDVIVAINTDPDCPMMQMATYALQGDLHQVIPAIIAEIKRQRGELAAA